MSISWIDPSRCSSATRSGATSISRTVPSVGVEWVNWSGSQRAHPGSGSCTPRSRARAARAIVATAPARSASPAPGTRSAPASVTDGTLLSLDALDRVLDVDGDGLVRVEAGIRLKALSRELHVRGLAMPNLGDIDAQSLAGALATGTHGTGTRLPNLSGPGRSSVELIARRRQRAHDRRRRRAARRARLARARSGSSPRSRSAVCPRSAFVTPTSPSRSSRCSTSCRSAPTRTTTSSSGPSRTPTSRSRARSTAPRTRRDRPGRAQRLRLATSLMDNHAFRARQRGRPALPGHDPAPEPLRLRGRLPARARRLVLRASSPPTGSCASRRWSTASRASTRSRRCAPPAPRSSATRSASRSSCASRAADDALLSPAHGRDSAFVAVHVFQGMAVRAGVPRGRGRAVGARRAPALGQALVPRRTRELAPALPALGRLPARSARELDPGGRFANAWVRDVLG